MLTCFADLGRVIIRAICARFCNGLKRGRYFAIENVRVSGRGLYVAVIERALHEFEVAGSAQQFSVRRHAGSHASENP